MRHRNVNSCDFVAGDRAPVPNEPPSQDEITRNWPQDFLENPVVSVVCHTYQHAGYIEDCLNGVLSQKTSVPFEIIVHDDASTDGTKAIVAEYAKRYPGLIHFISQETNQFTKKNKPPKFTLPAARGDYVAFCEGDDYWLDTEKLETQARFMTGNPKYAITGHDAIIVKDGKIIQTGKIKDHKKADFSPKEVTHGAEFLTATVMFVNRISQYESEHSYLLNGDTFLFSRLGEFGGGYILSNIGPAAYRVHDQGVWSSLSKAQRKSNAINTYFWIGEYYKRTEKYSSSQFFLGEACYQLLSGAPEVSLSLAIKVNYTLLRFAVSTRVPRLFARLRWIKLRVGSY